VAFTIFPSTGVSATATVAALDRDTGRARDDGSERAHASIVRVAPGSAGREQHSTMRVSRSFADST
jgi:hypothetical protein